MNRGRLIAVAVEGGDVFAVELANIRRYQRNDAGGTTLWVRGSPTPYRLREDVESFRARLTEIVTQASADDRNGLEQDNATGRRYPANSGVAVGCVPQRRPQRRRRVVKPRSPYVAHLAPTTVVSWSESFRCPGRRGPPPRRPQSPESGRQMVYVRPSSTGADLHERAPGLTLRSQARCAIAAM
jgi:hypothetical protein